MMRSIARRVTGGRWPQVRPGEQLSCPEVGRLLQRYLDGELTAAAEIDALATHLDDCERCGLEAETYRHIKEALASRRPTTPSESIDRLRRFGEQLADGT